MRHHVAGRKLNRTSNQRKALFKNLVLSLLEHGEIETTEAKAKSIKGLVDTLIHKAQRGGVATARVLSSFFGTRAIVQKLMQEIAPAMKGRVSGFTRIIRLGNRVGDDAPKVKMELVVKPQQKVEEKGEVKKPDVKETPTPVVEMKKAAEKKDVPKKSAKK
ncbi:MAG TPA: 50S ribosomal protein L17 [Patescibacteria group bacterium]|nr:50S ribosomal protein L17 [Patescibacteria group bacterium]